MMATNDNARFTREVLSALQADSFLRRISAGIRVDADDGVVTLTGSMESPEDRQAAIDAARRVVGVREVVNHITLMGQRSYSRPDADLQSEVQEELRKDISIDPDRFHVRSQFSVIHLSGEAESEEERDAALAAIHRVPGVEGIEDNTTVRVPDIDR
jgi:hyperosmotically inducible protein